jgi:hypothetical protein
LSGGHARRGLVLGVFSVFPMLNILAVTSYLKLTRKAPGGPFFVGFGLSRATAIVVWFSFWMMADEGWLISTVLRFLWVEIGIPRRVLLRSWRATVDKFLKSPGDPGQVKLV